MRMLDIAGHIAFILIAAGRGALAVSIPSALPAFDRYSGGRTFTVTLSID